MAFQVGDIKITGTIDGISFYRSVFGWLVRMKGGPTRKQFNTSPAFERSRENSVEFTLCSKAASALRRIIVKQTSLKDKALYHRLIKLMRLLANEDQTSVRGKRDPFKGLQTLAGQTHLKEFEVSAGLNLYDILLAVNIIPTPHSDQHTNLQSNGTRPRLRRKSKPQVYWFQPAERRFLVKQISFVLKPFVGRKHATINTGFG